MKINLRHIYLINLVILTGLYLTGNLLLNGLVFFGLLGLTIMLVRKLQIVFGLLLILIGSLPLMYWYQNGIFLNGWGYAMIVMSVIFSISLYLEMRKENK